MQALFRASYGVLLLCTLLLALPQSRRFFLSERWDGYAQSSLDVDLVQNPFVLPVVLVVWLCCTVLLVLGVWTVWAALVNLMLCRYFFVRMRWKGVLRGMGAPGFMTYWVGFAVFVLELTTSYGPELRWLALFVMQVDFALIILSSGVYKITAGYPRNHGMELGLVNPEWGYWPNFYRRFVPEHLVIKTLNHLAWSTEVVSAALMLVPVAEARLLGGLLIIISFAFIATQIRLGVLCEMVMVCGVLFVPAGSALDRWVAGILPAQLIGAPAAAVAPAWLDLLLRVSLWTYLALLPLAHAGLYYNFYARRSLPKPLQLALERYTNFFGIIIWRVFSVDVVNFFVRIYRFEPLSGRRVLVSGWGQPRTGLRYSHVGESITVTSVFTTLKYYPSNSARFTDRLLRYARTVPREPGESLLFEYTSVSRLSGRFEFTPVAEFVVDLDAGTIEERVIDPTVSLRAAHSVSPVHEGVRPGSYVPLAS
jgi:hypothetical protein